jgi:hypothetical protein
MGGASGAFTATDAGNNDALSGASNNPTYNIDFNLNNGGFAINNNTGGGGSHNNLQPYITCYMWKRTN